MENTLAHQEDKLKLLTKQLINHTIDLENVFNDPEIQPENSKAFFQFVKERTEEVFHILEDWERAITEHPDSLLHPSMLTSTVDNLRALIMHSYYRDVRRRRFMEIKRSCLYTLRFVLEKIEHE